MATSLSGALPSHHGVPARVPPSRPYYQKAPLPVCRACASRFPTVWYQYAHAGGRGMEARLLLLKERQVLPYSSVLKGEMGFRIADAEVAAGPGWYMLKPQRVRS
jgi:hypothetical protein